MLKRMLCRQKGCFGKKGGVLTPLHTVDVDNDDGVGDDDCVCGDDDCVCGDDNCVCGHDI